MIISVEQVRERVPIPCNGCKRVLRYKVRFNDDGSFRKPVGWRLLADRVGDGEPAHYNVHAFCRNCSAARWGGKMEALR